MCPFIPMSPRLILSCQSPSFVRLSDTPRVRSAHTACCSHICPWWTLGSLPALAVVRSVAVNVARHASARAPASQFLGLIPKCGAAGQCSKSVLNLPRNTMLFPWRLPHLTSCRQRRAVLSLRPCWHLSLLGLFMWRFSLFHDSPNRYAQDYSFMS